MIPLLTFLSFQLFMDGKPFAFFSCVDVQHQELDQRNEEKTMSLVKRSEKGLLTPDNCVVAFIDHQPQMLFGTSNAW